jgi:transposase-like protein
MRSRSESRRRGSASSRLKVMGAEASSALAALEGRFAQFREQHAPGTRVPEELRAAVFSALSEGVPVSALRRKCGLASSQIEGWKASHDGGSVRGRRETAKVRAFSVVDDEVAGRATPEAVPEQALELRVGPWAVSVRLAGQAPAGRG